MMKQFLHITCILLVLSAVAVPASADTKQYVDLGLPSRTQWATCNIGATNPSDYGSLFAWGEITAKTSFSPSNYKYCNSSSLSTSSLTKYNSTDGKSELETSDDAAYKLWGSSWRIPTKVQLQELVDNCTIRSQGDGTYKVTGPNGNYIILPLAGMANSSFLDNGTGYYWSRDCDKTNETGWGAYVRAYCLFIYSSTNVGNCSRCYGYSIRPVSTTLATRVNVTSISVFAPSSSVDVGSSIQLTATCNPSNATDKRVAWSSSNSSIATVDANGNVTGVAAGSVTVYATAMDGSGKKGSYSLSVIQPETPANVITSNAAGATVSFSTSGTYEWEWDSANRRLRSTNYHVDSSTSSTTITISTTKTTALSFDYSVSSESGYDKLTIKLDGTTIVNAISGSKSSSYSGSIASGSHTLVLSYTKDSSYEDNNDRAYFSNLKLDNFITVSSISLSPTTLNLAVGDTHNLSASILPSNASNKSVTWSSSNSNVASVSATGVVTAVATGTATINCTAADGSGKKGTCSVTVAPHLPVTIGTGTNMSEMVPFCTDDVYSTTAIIYPSSAIGTSGLIGSIAFYQGYEQYRTLHTKSLKIYMGYAFSSSFSSPSTTPFLQQIGSDEALTLVYSGSPDLGGAVGWETFSLSTPFLYNGTGNLVVVISKTVDTTIDNPTEWLRYRYTEVSNSVLMQHSDDDLYDAIYSNEDYTLSNKRPNMKIQFVDNIIPSTLEYVDLGLPSGTQWANMNLGATTTTGYGYFLAWGETSPKYAYSNASYLLSNGSTSLTSSSLTKYNSSDGRTELLTADDAASVIWGSSWRTPTSTQLQELIDNCTFEHIVLYGESVVKFTGPNGNYVYFPLPGYYYQQNSDTWNHHACDGSYGFYSSRNCATDDKTRAYFMYINNASAPSVFLNTLSRAWGNTIRPVSTTLATHTKVSSISISGATSIVVGSSIQLTANCSPSNATDKRVAWSSSNSSIATVDANGNVTGVAAGTVSIIATAKDGSGKTASYSVNVVADTGDPFNGHEYVDLGLPSGTLWATCNVGASNPEGFGEYYAWGETSPKTSYSWSNYSLCNSSSTSMKKYCLDSSYGTVDNLSVLEATDDAASANFGGVWRTPTKDEWTELKTKCSWGWTTKNNVRGYLVTGSNGNTIFIPAAGHKEGSSYRDSNSAGSYWSATLGSGNTPFNVDFDWGGKFIDNNTDGYRYTGQSVRPVCSRPSRQGDLNGDGVIDAIDSAIVLQHYLNGTTDQLNPAIADVDGDGVIDAVDSALILQMYLMGN